MEPVIDGPGVPAPAAVLRDESFDSVALLALWLVRRCFWTLVWLGLIVVVLSGSLDNLEGLETLAIASAADAREVARSPQALLLLAPATRLGSGWLAMLLAFPLARRLQRHADRELRRSWRHPAVWSDRWYLVKALRDWRWTSSVRRLARQRLGRAGPPILVLDVTLLITGIVLLPVTLAVLVPKLA